MKLAYRHICTASGAIIAQTVEFALFQCEAMSEGVRELNSSGFDQRADQ